jgi:hypothetical protein
MTSKLEAIAEVAKKYAEARQDFADHEENERALLAGAEFALNLLVEEREALQKAKEENLMLRTALKLCEEECGMDDPNFGDFTELQFAARLGLIYGHCRKALQEPSAKGEKDGK